VNDLLALYPVFLFFAASCVVGVVAGSRERNAIGWFLLALLITPIIAFAAVVSLPNGQRKPNMLDGRSFK
jgi:hypothetical protein